MNAHQIADDLRRKILSGDLTHGARLPSARDLAQYYGVSHQTVTNAITRLAALGMLRVGSGKQGTVVVAPPCADAYLGAFGPYDLTKGTAWRPAQGAGEARTLSVSTIPAPDWAAEYGLSGDIVRRTRVRTVDGVPAQYKATLMPYDIAARVPEGHAGVPPMLSPPGATSVNPPTGVSMSEWLGWGVEHTETVVTAEPMTANEAEILGLAEGTPGFRVVGTAKDNEGATVYVTLTVTPLHHRVTLDIQH
jgi:GntR family transcriptional regulator